MAHNYKPLQPVVLRLPPEDREAVRALARRRHCPESVILREAIVAYVRRQRAEEGDALRPAPEPLAKQYPGEWVALSGTDVIAHGKDGVAVFREARRQGQPVPRLFRVPDTAQDQFFMGL